MTRTRASMVVVLTVALAATVAVADDYVTYVGAIDVNLPLGRIVADPIRSKVYGITGTGDVVFMDRASLSVDNVVSTGRVLRDIDINPDGNHLTVLDNVTGEYWNQPPAVYALDFDLTSQSASGISLLQAPLYQMGFGRPSRIVGIATNQWVDVYQMNAATGAVLDTASGGYYGSATWSGPNCFVTNSTGTRLYRTELGISSIELIMFNTSTDNITQMDSRDVGSYSSEPVFLNSTDTSLYVGDVRYNPDNIDQVLGMYPEHIFAATGDDSLAFGVNGVYDPLWGTKLQDLPFGTNMMALGENEHYLYCFDTSTQKLHVMSVIPEPGTLLLLGLGGVGVVRRRR